MARAARCYLAPQRRARVIPGALCTGLVLVLAGCGTTVPLAARGADSANGLTADQTTGPRSSAPASDAPTAGELRGSAPGDLQGRQQDRPGPSVPASGGTPGSDSGASGGLGNVPGVTATTVKIGLEYISSASLGTFANTAGVKGVGQVDTLAAYQAVVAAVNRAGGVAGGRKLVLVPRNRSLSEDTAQAAQLSCAAFTEDDRVLAAAAALTQGSPLVSCLASRGVMSVTAGFSEAGSEHDFSHFAGRYVATSTADTISAARSYIDALVRQGFLTPRNKVGLLWFNFPDFKAAKDEGIVPALKAHGLSLDTDFQSSYSGNAAELGSIASQMQSAAFKFRAAGIDRVITLDYNGTLQFFFMNNAQQQGYHPLYGLGSWSDAEFLRANASAAQLAGSRGIGWLPAEDLAVGQQPKDGPHPRCAAAMTAANMPPAQAQADVIIENQACDVVFYLADLLKAARSLTPAGLALTASSLAARPSYSSFNNSYSSHKFWGAATYRDLGYGSACGCFTYSGPTRMFS